MGLISVRLYITEKGPFCLNFSIIIDILPWKTNHRSFFIENSSMNVESLNNRGVEITAGSYLASDNGTVSDCPQPLSTEALLIVNNYILDLLWGNQYLFSIWLLKYRWNRKDINYRYISFANIWFAAVIRNLRKMNMLLTSPNGSLLPTKILKTKCTENKKTTTKMHWEVRERKNSHQWKNCITKDQKKNSRS